MKTIVFPDRLNPVFVKELRQSIHDRTLPFAAIAVIAVQLIAGYLLWATRFNQQGYYCESIFTGSLSLFFCMLLVLRMIWAQRTGQERRIDGFDPQATTGYSVWRTVVGRLAAEACAIAALVLLALPWFVILGAQGGLPPDVAGRVPYLTVSLFAAGEGFHYITSFRLGRKYSAFILVVACIWLVGIFAWPMQGSFDTFLTFLLAGIAMICGQVQNRMPVRADRGVWFKCALLATALFMAWAYPDTYLWRGGPTLRFAALYGMGWLFMFGSLWERRAPSRRQIERAPRNAVLRFVSLFFGSGVLSGFLLSMTLFAASTAFDKEPSLAPMLLSVFYMQTALFFSCKWKFPPLAGWIVLYLTANMPCVHGELFPWATVFSANAEEFVGREIAVAVAAAACIVSIMLNAKLYWNFAYRYFERKTEK